MDDLLIAFSRGLYANWLWHKPLKLVVDAGEGLQLGLGSKVLAPTHLVMTHGHADHVLGLPGFVAARRFGMGDPDKPLTIVYPERSRGVEAARGTLERHWPREPFPVTWVPIVAGGELPYGKNRVLRAFAADHGSVDVALGYMVVERRRRLRAEYASAGDVEIRKLVSQGGRERLLEDYERILFAHTGDTMPLTPGLFRDADLLVHDATFLDVGDRREPIHASTREALAAARDANVRTLVLQHLSVRYDRDDAVPALRRQVADVGYAGACWLLDGRSFIRLTHEGAKRES
jgi:ribonuclease Z